MLVSFDEYIRAKYLARSRASFKWAIQNKRHLKRTLFQTLNGGQLADDYLNSIGDRKYEKVAVQWKEGCVIGVAVYRSQGYEGRRIIYLTSFLVHPRQRGQGWGRIIWRELVDKISRGGIAVGLTVTRSSVGFWRKMGFVEEEGGLWIYAPLG